MTGNDIDRLDLTVGEVPHPGLIRSRIEAALAGRASEAGPEQAIGQAVASAVAGLTGAGLTGAGLTGAAQPTNGASS
jgi:hypothetical protein